MYTDVAKHCESCPQFVFALGAGAVKTIPHTHFGANTCSEAIPDCRNRHHGVTQNKGWEQICSSPTVPDFFDKVANGLSNPRPCRL